MKYGLDKIYSDIDLCSKYRITIRYFYELTKTIDCIISKKYKHNETTYSFFCVYEDGTGGYEWMRPDCKNLINRNVIKAELIKYKRNEVNRAD